MPPSEKNKIDKTIKVRKAGQADLRELQHIGVASYLPHYTHLWKDGGLDWYMQRCFGDETLISELSDDNIEYYFVRAEERHIGFMKLVLLKPVPDSDIRNALYLEKLYFVKEWTGKGVGRELMQLAFKRAQELNRDCVWLTAMDTSDKPIAAYENIGFTIHSRARLGFELMKEEFRGMVVMTHYFNKIG
ncbi:MAG: GNAT family N-acetyltransferase [Pyrinomonadaceae bacterium]